MSVEVRFKVRQGAVESPCRCGSGAGYTAINNAKQLIFIGYSLPNDDIEYRSIFRISSSQPKKVYVVLHKEGADNTFISAAEALQKFSDKIDEVKRYCEIFGLDNVYVNFAGFPDALDKILEILKQT